MTKPTGLLVLSVSAGAGHVRAAEALCAQATLEHQPISATHLDVMQCVSSTFRKLYTEFYLTLVNKHPALWGYLYQVTNEAQPDSSLQKLRRGIERLSTRALLREIDARRPDMIICTHFLPAEILSGLIASGRVQCPVWVQVTDFDVHRMWIQKGMHGYFVASDEIAFRMQALGIAADKIHVTGIPIMPAFSQPGSRADCAAQHGIDPARLTILLMGGGAGLGSLDAIAAHLLRLPAEFQLIVMAGKNQLLLQALQTLATQFPGRLLAQGFTTHVEQLMACADLAITKPGGLTTSECLAMGLPMIVNNPIPGQEERNADFLLEQGVGLKAIDATTLDYRIRSLIAHPDKLADMASKSLALGRPDAARAALRIIMSDLA
ncbi:MGDG synthase family glycosyltransferase [Actimicrobium antarcticum]|uniref:Glycosyltransferase n=1 Tax=Actimicrobium antarcticum TaxID=1051899 RepID=A0ABP7TSM6_9BURK